MRFFTSHLLLLSILITHPTLSSVHLGTLVINDKSSHSYELVVDDVNTIHEFCFDHSLVRFVLFGCFPPLFFVFWPWPRTQQSFSFFSFNLFPCLFLLLFFSHNSERPTANHSFRNTRQKKWSTPPPRILNATCTLCHSLKVFKILHPRSNTLIHLTPTNGSIPMHPIGFFHYCQHINALRTWCHPFQTTQKTRLDSTIL